MNQTIIQDPEAKLDYVADFRLHCARRREPETGYQSGTRVEASTGFQYNASAAGTTAVEQPRWPKTAGQTVKDGSVTWTCEVPNGAGLQRTLSSVVWTGDTVTIGTPANDTTSSTVFISGGVEGQSYEIACEGTFSDGSVEVRAFTLSVER